MSPERWQKAKEIFHAALACAPGERSVFLDRACGADRALRKEVESLVAAHEKDGSFIDSPAYEAASDLLTNDRAELKPGQTIGSYEIVSFISRGGMGEVYLAQDQRLPRRVALKLLPSSWTRDASRLNRFEQEARAASALNHPNIITIYEIREANSNLMIVTEFVEGETLRERILTEKPELSEALGVAIQIADALSAAHRAGIIHRDIKPDNIMVRPDGYVKVLDFGLAKLTAPALAVSNQAPTRQVKTGSGIIMGTIGYMSPEQARGHTVDARSDIFNLGAVLYEMVSGQRPFDGDTPSDILAAILKTEPPLLSHFTPEAPAELVRIVAKALRKDREQRYQVIEDMLLDLKSLKEQTEFQARLDQSEAPGKSNEAARSHPKNPSAEKTSTSTHEIKTGVSTIRHSLSAEIKRHKRGAMLAVMTLSVAMIVGVFGLYQFWDRGRSALPASEKPQVLRTTQLTFSTALDQFPSLSPDGNSIAYCSDQNGSFEIYVKQLTPGGRDIQLTADGQQNLEPAWSPDGQHIAYFSKNRGGIWVVPTMGGSPKQLVEFGSRPAWSRDGLSIAFQSAAPNGLGGHGQNAMPPSTIWIIPSQGGVPKQITQAGNPSGGHGAPSWSPDGKRIVFDASDFASNSLWSVSIGDGDLKEITTEGSDGIYSPDGNVFFLSRFLSTRRGLSQAHVSPTGESLGEPFQLAGGDGTLIFHPTITADGKKIAYAVLKISSNLWSISVARGSGEKPAAELFTRDTSMRHNLARFSRDGKRIAFNRWRVGTSGDIWIAEADGKNLTQLTSNPATDAQPNWFPKGDQIAFLSDRNNDHLALWSITLATGREEPLLDLGAGVEFAVLSPDGKQVAFNSKKSGTINVWTTPISGGEQKQLTYDNELMGFPCWSPDGKWLAFEIKRGDDQNIAIIPSGGGTPTQITFEKGLNWAYSWSPDGDKIAFAGFRDGVWNIYSVAVSTKEQKQLTHYSKLNAFARYPAWSPSGNQIVYEYAETIGNIWLIELK